MTDYIYDSTDFSDGINLDSLTQEIANTSIDNELNGITVTENQVIFDFEDSLSGGEITELDGVVASHQGNPPDYISNSEIIERGIYTLSNGDSTATIGFINPRPNTDYSIFFKVVNESDNPPSIYDAVVIVKSRYEFTLEFTGIIDSNNYKLHWMTSSYNTINDQPKIFGTQFYSAESESESITTSNSFQDKVTLTTGDLPSGNYLVSWYAEFAIAFFNTTYVQLYHTTLSSVIADARHNNYDSALSSEWSWPVFSGSKKLTLSGVNSFVIQYKAYYSGNNTYIRRARIFLWRIE